MVRVSVMRLCAAVLALLATVASAQTLPPASAPAAVPMDWSNQTHLLQAVLIAVCVGMFVAGYNSGRRLT